MIDDWPEAAREVHEKIHHRHLTGQYECDRPREYAEYDDYSTNELERAGDTGEGQAPYRMAGSVNAAKEPEHFLSAMLSQNGTSEDSQ